MCGIAGFVSTKPQDPRTIHTVLSAIESRGGHAWGWATNEFYQKQTGKVPTIQSQLKLEAIKDTKMMIMHSRFATHGLANDVSCAHPFVSARWAIVHNGIIDNEHQNQKTKCDSEAILKLLIEKNDIKKMCEELVGMFRIAILDKKENKLIIVNDDNPVWFGKRYQSEIWFASEHTQLPQDCWMRKGKSNSIMTLSINQNNIIELKIEYFTKKTRVYTYNVHDWEKHITHQHNIIGMPVHHTTIPIPQAQKHHYKGDFNYEVCKKCDEPTCDKCPMLQRS